MLQILKKQTGMILIEWNFIYLVLIYDLKAQFPFEQATSLANDEFDDSVAYEIDDHK